MSAVTFAGTLFTRSASKIASVGNILSDTSGYFISFAGSDTTAKLVTSLPVPEVVGTAISATSF